MLGVEQEEAMGPLGDRAGRRPIISVRAEGGSIWLRQKPTPPGGPEDSSSSSDQWSQPLPGLSSPLGELNTEETNTLPLSAVIRFPEGE